MSASSIRSPDLIDCNSVSGEEKEDGLNRWKL